MKFQFATCVRSTALGFLQKLYPSQEITDTDEVAALLDLVQDDIIRIPDPYMHGQRVAVFPSKNWDKAKKDEYMKVCNAFANKYN